MPAIPEEIFYKAVRMCVERNTDFVPPASTDGAFYLRPVLFGSGPEIGMSGAPEYTFLVFGTPVGNFYKDGVKPVSCLVIEDYDRCKLFMDV